VHSFGMARSDPGGLGFETERVSLVMGVCIPLECIYHFAWVE
jgi:hypothetical protein